MDYVYANRTGRGTFARKLARRLGIASVTPNEIPLGARLINWGSTSASPVRCNWLGNTPAAVSIISNKVRTFRILEAAGIPMVPHTTEKQVAAEWLAQGRRVYERHVLTGHSGKGIVVKKGPDAVLADAPLYTMGISEPFFEYRIHVAYDEVLAVQQKRRMTAVKREEMGLVVPDKEARHAVRTYLNGWVFAVQDVALEDKVLDVAKAAIVAAGAVTGCVDLAIGKKTGDIYVIELNSAPALRSDTVLNAYVVAFTKRLRG